MIKVRGPGIPDSRFVGKVVVCPDGPPCGSGRGHSSSSFGACKTVPFRMWQLETDEIADIHIYIYICFTLLQGNQKRGLHSIWVWVKFKTTRNWIAGFSPWFHLPAFHFRVTLCLTHSHLERRRNRPAQPTLFPPSAPALEAPAASVRRAPQLVLRGIGWPMGSHHCQGAAARALVVDMFLFLGPWPADGQGFSPEKEKATGGHKDGPLCHKGEHDLTP